jgi:hypothetical protein
MRAIVKIIICCILFVLTSCGGSNNNASTNTSNMSGVIGFITPVSMFSLSSQQSYGYIVVMNNSNQTVKNVSYTIVSSIGGGNSFILDTASARNCSTLPKSGGKCTLRFIVPAGESAGSFSLKASVKQGNQVLYNANSGRIGVRQVVEPKNSLQPILITAYDKIIAGNKYILFTGLVTSKIPQHFNMVTLLDNNNIPLDNQEVVSGNLGNQLTNLSKGSTFAILVPINSVQENSQSVKVEFSEVIHNRKTISFVLNETNYFSTVKNTPIVRVLPENLHLSREQPKQVLTFYNDGDLPVELNSLVANSSDLNIDFKPAKINPGEYITATAKLVESNIPASSYNITLSASNSEGFIDSKNINVDANIVQLKDSVSYYARLKDSPKPGLILNFSGDNNYFITTTKAITTSKILELTNSGNTIESGFTFKLPTGFAISSLPSTNSEILPCNISTDGKAVLNSLSQGASCVVLITYTNHNLSSKSSANSNDIMINYSYNRETSVSNNDISTNNQVFEAKAKLVITPTNGSNIYFGNLLNNNESYIIESYLIQNKGEAATSIANIVSSNPSLFSLVAIPVSNNGCSGNNILNSGESCTIGVLFGPTSLPSQSESTLLTVYSGSGANNESSSLGLSGFILQAFTANINLNPSTGSGFVTGGGGTNSPFELEIGNLATITYTYSNLGHAAAKNFYVSIKTEDLPNGVTLAENNCGSSPGTAINLEALTGTCQITYNVTGLSAGSINLNSNVMTAYWYDNADPSGKVQPAPSQITYINVFNPLSLTISSSQGTPPNIGVLQLGQTFTVTASLNGGYQGMSDPLISLNIANSNPNLIMTESNLYLTGYDSQESSSIIVPVQGSSGILGNATLTFKNTGEFSLPIENSVFNFSVQTNTVQAWQSINNQVPVATMAVDGNGVLYFVEQMSSYGATQYVYQGQNTNTSFTQVAHFSGVSTIAVNSNRQMTVGSTYENEMYIYTVGNSDPSTYSLSSVIDNYPTVARTDYFSNYIYWGDIFGYWYYTAPGGYTTSSDHSSQHCEEVIDMAIENVQAPMIYASCVMEKDLTTDYEGYRVHACYGGSYCKKVYTNTNTSDAPSITLDSSNNLYIGLPMLNGVIMCPNGSPNADCTNPQQFVLPPLIPTDGTLNSYNDSLCLSTNGCGVMSTIVRYDTKHNLVLAIFDYPNYQAMFGYDQYGNIVATYPPFPTLAQYPTVSKPAYINYTFDQTVVVPSLDGAIYFLGQSGNGNNGTIYYMKY